MELRGQTPQLSLSSALLRDERFHNLGRNTWVLASSEVAAEDEDDAVLVDDPPEPPTRTPAIYAEEGVRFSRIHLPRELWERARQAGVIAINWPPDSQNQSVKRFRQIRVGDRVVVYLQSGEARQVARAYLGAAGDQHPDAAAVHALARDIARCKVWVVAEFMAIVVERDLVLAPAYTEPWQTVPSWAVQMTEVP